jgi:hypothetical protein
VVSINAGANTITLDGDFGGLLAANQVLELQNMDSLASRINECAWIGDDTGDVNSTKDSDIWGEL